MESYTKEIKITLGGFAFGFFFSLMLGLIVGNPIGIVIARAFIASLLFAFIVFGIMYIVKRYVPEITNAADGVIKPRDNSTVSQVDSKTGSKIDYVVGDEKSEVGNINKKEGKNILDNNFAVGSDTLNFRENTETSSLKKGVEKKDGNLSNKDVEGVIENAEELPPIEELLSEEEVVPETEVEEEVMSKSDKKGNNDYIKIGDVKIPNEPEIIAKAIKKVMNNNE